MQLVIIRCDLTLKQETRKWQLKLVSLGVSMHQINWKAVQRLQAYSCETPVFRVDVDSPDHTKLHNKWKETKAESTQYPLTHWHKSDEDILILKFGLKRPSHPHKNRLDDILTTLQKSQTNTALRCCIRTSQTHKTINMSFTTETDACIISHTCQQLPASSWCTADGFVSLSSKFFIT